MTNAIKGQRTRNTQAIASTDKTAPRRASATSMGEKLRTAPNEPTSRSSAVTALLTTPSQSPTQLGSALGAFGAQIAGFHETGRVRAPNPRAIDTKAMAHNLDRILNNALPRLQSAVATMKHAPPELQQAARDLAVTLHDEKNAIEAWLWKYGGSSATIDLRADRFGAPLQKMQTFSDELKAAAATWGGAAAAGGVDQLKVVVYGGKLLDQMRAKGKALDAALHAIPVKKAAVEKAEAALLKVMQPLFAALQDTAVMADAQSAIKNDYWQTGDTVASIARHVKSAINDSGLGMGAYGVSDHTRGWLNYASATMDNLTSQHMAVDFHQRGNPPARESTWLDDPRIPDWRR